MFPPIINKRYAVKVPLPVRDNPLSVAGDYCLDCCLLRTTLRLDSIIRILHLITHVHCIVGLIFGILQSLNRQTISTPTLNMYV